MTSTPRSISISIFGFSKFKIQIQVCLHSTKSNKTEQNETNISVDTQPFIPRKTRLRNTVEVPETPLHGGCIYFLCHFKNKVTHPDI